MKGRSRGLGSACVQFSDWLMVRHRGSHLQFLGSRWPWAMCSWSKSSSSFWWWGWGDGFLYAELFRKFASSTIFWCLREEIKQRMCQDRLLGGSCCQEAPSGPAWLQRQRSGQSSHLYSCGQRVEGRNDLQDGSSEF